MADTVYKDAVGGQVRYEDVVTDPVANRRIPKSVPSDKAGAPLFDTDNPGKVTIADGLGTDGSAPPTIAGSGVRGWLRGIYERLTGTLTVSASSLPLPSGAATASAQTTGNTSLASIDGKLPALSAGRLPVDIGSATVTISGPVTVSNEVEVKNDAANPLPVRNVNGVTAVRTFVPVSVFDGTSATTITNTVVQVVAADANRTDLKILNTGSADVELWFGARPDNTTAGQLVGQAIPQGEVLYASGGGLKEDVRVPTNAIYASAKAATGLVVRVG